MSMIEIGQSVVSLEVFRNHFVCHLEKCSGACCVFGDAGAPVEEEEARLMEEVLPNVIPYMAAKGLEAVNEQGVTVIDSDGDRVTPLVGPGEECAYVFFENGIARCAIETAYLAGEIQFQKPISCHLYPIRISKYSSFEAVNYHLWHICSPACVLGDALGIPLYRFLREPLIRKYGEAWYKELERTANALKDQNLL